MELDDAAWTVVNDDGTGQSGDVWDNDWTQAAKASIDDLLHSATNPTISPADIIDEVAAARGNLASLSARLLGVIDLDGNIVLPASAVTTTTLQSAVGANNVAINGDFFDWSAGAAAAPDDWTLSGAGGTIARTGIGEADTTHFGTGSGYAAKITRAGTDVKLLQQVVAAADLAKFSNIKSQKVVAIAKGKTNIASHLRLVVDDGVLVTTGTYHTGGNTEEHISVTHTISAAATKLDVYAQVVGSNGDAYVGGVEIFFSDVVPSDWKPLTAIPYATSTRAGRVSTTAQDFAGIKNFKEHPTFEPGSSATPCRVSGLPLKDTGPRTATAVATEQDLTNASLPAGTLDTNSQGIRLTIWGTAANTVGAKIIRLYFGSTSLGSTLCTLTASTASERWMIRVTIQRRDATNQRAIAEIKTDENGLSVVDRILNTSPAETLANAITIRSTCQNAGGALADVVQEGFLVEVLG